MALTRHVNFADAINAQDAPAFHQIADASTGSVSNATALSALSITNLNDGVIKFVSTFRSFFRLSKTNPDAWTPDGVVYVTALGGIGVWIRLELADPYWVTQTDWYWDPVAGNDENSGASGFPIKTHEEFYRRTVGRRFSSSVTVNILDNIPDQVFRVGYHAPSVSYQAALTVFGTGTLTAVTNLNKTTNQAWEITDTGIATSWTASDYVNKLLVAKNGATVVGTAWVDKDLGSKKARMAAVSTSVPFVTAGATAAPSNTTTGTFTTGNTYTVYSMKTCAISFAILQSYNLQIYGLQFTGSVTNFGNQTEFGQTTLVFCKFSASAITGFAGGIGTTQCLFETQTVFSGIRGTVHANPSFHAFVQVQNSKLTAFTTNIYCTNGGYCRYTHGSSSNGLGSLPDIALFDIPSANTGLTVDHQSFFQVGQIWGTDNTTVSGWLVSIGGGSWIYVAVAPNATRSGGVELRVMDQDYLFSDVGTTGVVDSRNAGMVVTSS